MAQPLPRPFGAYVLLKSLGQGAMGDIHLARPFNPHRGVPTPIVIKRLHGELADNDDFVRRFRHEADVAVSVDSINVAKVFDVGSVDETLYIAMEFIPGWPLSRFLDSVIQSGRHASVASIIDLIDGGLVGMQALHTAKDIKTGQPLGIVHRDISPKNLMVGEDGLMRLIDLGLGKSNAQDWKTRTGVVMGSVGYMPPEQVTAEGVDLRADLYAMAVVLFEMLALRNYIKRGPIPVMLRGSLAPEFQPVTKYRPDVPAGLDNVLKKALAHDRDHRYQSADEFREALRQVVPEKKSKGGMTSLIGDLFAENVRERQHEISQLLTLPLPVVDEPPEQDRTVVFVQREGVAPLSEQDFQPTRVTESGYTAAGMSPTAVRPVLPGGRQTNPGVQILNQGAPPPYGQAFSNPHLSFTDARSSVSSLSNSAIPARSSVPAWASTTLKILGAVLLMVGTVIFDRTVIRPAPPEFIAAPSPEAPTSTQDGPRAQAGPRNTVIEPPIEQAQVDVDSKPRTPRTAVHPKKEKPREDTNPTTPAEPSGVNKPPRKVGLAIEATEESVKAASQAIIQRATELRKTQPDNQRIQEIIRGASAERHSGAWEKAAVRLKDLDSQLAALEKG